MFLSDHLSLFSGEKEEYFELRGIHVVCNFYRFINAKPVVPMTAGQWNKGVCNNALQVNLSRDTVTNQCLTTDLYRR